MPLFDLRLLFTNGSIVGQNVDFWDHLRSAVRNIYAVTTASMSHICYAICDSVQNFKDFDFDCLNSSSCFFDIVVFVNLHSKGGHYCGE